MIPTNLFSVKKKDKSMKCHKKEFILNTFLLSKRIFSAI